MLRWYLWVALVLWMPIVVVLGLAQTSIPVPLERKAFLLAFVFGLLVTVIAATSLRFRFKDDRNAAIHVRPQPSRRTIAAAFGVTLLLLAMSFAGWLNVISGRAIFEMVLDDEIGWWPYSQPWPQYDHPSIPYVEAAILIAGFTPGLIAATLAAAWSRRHWGPHQRVRRGLCGGCGYELRGLKVEEGDCVVCPECGAAWRLKSASWRS